MKIGLIGYGAMGRLVGGLATQRGHEIALKLDIEGAERGVEDLVRSLGECDVAIDFSIALSNLLVNGSSTLASTEGPAPGVSAAVPTAGT